MYFRTVSFKATPGRKSEIVAIADKFVPLIKSQEGNQGCKFLIDDEAGEYGMIINWDTQEHAEAAKAVVGPQLIPMLGEIASGPVSINLYEVYEP
jgi:heme-degrading monooxygenase HmoA